MAKRALVFGSGGQLGGELVRVLGERAYEVTGMTRAALDITSAEAVEQCIAGLTPAVVFNAAAYNQVDLAEKEPHAAYQANGLAVRNLAMACRQTDSKLVHFSTDYVFDGKSTRPYYEYEPTHPLGAYGVSKLAGELYAQAYLETPLLIRTSGVFGPGGLHTARGNFVELMLRLAHGGQPIRVVEDHVASPTYAPWLASRSVDLLERGQNGVFHVGGGSPSSWYEYARSIFAAARLSPELKSTNSSEYRTAARRPKFSALSNRKMELAGVAAMPPLQEALASYMEAREQLLAASTARS